MCVGGRDLSEPRLTRDGSVVVYGVSEQGVAHLVLHSLAEELADQLLATEPPLRPGRGLGGGGWCFNADETAVVYVGADGDLWLQSIHGGESLQVTDFGSERSVSAPCCSPDEQSVVYMVDQAAIYQSFFDGRPDQRVDDGTADFCFDPFVDAGSVRWLAWNVPDMPWDRSRVQRRIFTGEGAGEGEVTDLLVHGSVQQPRVLPDGRSICVRDDDGWLNVWIAGWPAVAEPFEHAGPTWGPGQRSYAWSPDSSRIAFTRNERGFGRLCVVELDGVVDVDSHAGPAEVARGVHGQLSWAGNRLACLRSGARTPPEVVVYDTNTWQRTVVAASADWPASELVEPELVEVKSSAGSIHARLYKGDGRRGLIVWLHGGPTDQWQVSFMPRIAYWRAHGWNVLVPDHRGSTGHGRDYQQALRGHWGVLDVHDVVTVTEHAHAMGWGDARHTVVMGGSSGGFTALGAVAAEPSHFAAAVVLYPVTDLADLAVRSHRFERHYTDSLIGPLPTTASAYRERSPIEHADRFATTPLLILHGDGDPVVPVEQSSAFAERMRAAGGQVELHVYEGEGHGFRQRANQLDEYGRIASFLAHYVPLASS